MENEFEVVRTTPVDAFATTRVVRARDHRFGSMQVILPHVVKCHDLVRRSLDSEFNFTATIDGHDAKHHEWLTASWGTRTFCVVDHANVQEWLAKAERESRRDEIECVVCLCPARTNTDYFHQIVLKHANHVRFIKGRLKMMGFSKQSPFPSCVVVFGTPPESTTAPPALVFAREGLAE